MNTKRDRINQMIRGGKKVMKSKEKRNGILFWNEEEERLSTLYINDNGFLEMFQPRTQHIKNYFV